MVNKDKISTKLSEKKNENPFLVPDGYFESFSSRFQDRLAEERKKEERSLYLVLKPYIYTVSSVAAILILTFIFYKTFVDKGNTTVLSNSEIASIFEEDVYDLEGTYLSDNYSDEIEADDLMFLDEDDPSYEDEIIQYLLDENVEIESIVNEL